jgi:hypothetical protein
MQGPTCLLTLRGVLWAGALRVTGMAGQVAETLRATGAELLPEGGLA